MPRKGKSGRQGRGGKDRGGSDIARHLAGLAAEWKAHGALLSEPALLTPGFDAVLAKETPKLSAALGREHAAFLVALRASATTERTRVDLGRKCFGHAESTLFCLPISGDSADLRGFFLDPGAANDDPGGRTDAVARVAATFAAAGLSKGRSFALLRPILVSRHAARDVPPGALKRISATMFEAWAASMSNPLGLASMDGGWVDAAMLDAFPDARHGGRLVPDGTRIDGAILGMRVRVSEDDEAGTVDYFDVVQAESLSRDGMPKAGSPAHGAALAAWLRACECVTAAHGLAICPPEPLASMPNRVAARSSTVQPKVVPVPGRGDSRKPSAFDARARRHGVVDVPIPANQAT